jgi:prepilin-type N-terminal cleavage/methylation domain-containing protein
MLGKIKAFTMAEILVVLGIIGVVAVLTLPNLSRNAEDRKVIAGLRKSYAELDTIYQSIATTYGKPYDWNVANTTSAADMTKTFGDYFAEVSSISKDCGTSTGCFSGTIDSDTSYRKFLMKDGSSVGMKVSQASTVFSNVNTTSDNCNGGTGDMGTIVVDVNGLKGENNYGYDTFYINICSKGLVPKGEKAMSTSTDSSTAWVLKAGNRDYLKCSGLNWNTKRSCK